MSLLPKTQRIGIVRAIRDVMTQEKPFAFEDLFTFEMANNHQGSVAHGKKIIDAMAKIAKDHNLKATVKLQFRNLDTFIHPDHREKSDNKHIPRFLSTKLTREQFKELVDYTRASGLLTMATPFDEDSVDMLEDFKIDILKVASCSAQDWPLLRRIRESKKPIIISTGGLTMREIDKLVTFFDKGKNQYMLQHCVAIYPTPMEKLGLNQIALMKKRYPHLVIGYSTHEEPSNLEAVQMAYAKGARTFERHVGIPTDTIKLNAYSSTPEQVEAWVKAWERAKVAEGPEGERTIDQKEKEDLMSLQRGVFFRRPVKAGKTITASDVYFAMPISEGQLSSGEFEEGMLTDKDYEKNEGLHKNLLADADAVKRWSSVIQDVRSMLRDAGIKLDGKSHLEISHHDGVEMFGKTGAVLIEVINREYCKKLILQFPGQRHPSHKHEKKEETFHLVYGDLHVRFDDPVSGNAEGKRKTTLKAGETLLMPRGVSHEFWTHGGAIFEEISTTAIGSDSFYDDPKIASMPRAARKTIIMDWLPT